MSFAEQFRNQTLPIFQHVYLRIQDLEHLSRSEDPSQTNDKAIDIGDQNRSPFRKGLIAELTRVRNFIDAYSEELWIRLSRVLERLDQSFQLLNASNRRTILNQGALDLVHRQLIEIGESLMSLEEFQRQNILAGAILVQQHESRSQKKLSCIHEMDPEILHSIEQDIVGDRSFDPVVAALSDAFAGLRKLQNQNSVETGKLRNAESGFRSIRKFWIHPADVLRVKCTVLQNLPILFFEKGPKLNSVASKLLPLRKQDRQDSSCSLISSIYFDNEDFEIYQNRLKRENGASLIRLRWYGNQSIDPEDSVLIERKVQKDGWTGEEPYKERAQLLRKEIQDFIQGKTVQSMNETNPKTGLLKDLQNEILLKKERPSLRTEYRRLVFQDSTSNRVRVSLDTDLRMIKESRTGQDQSEEQDLSKKQEIVHFPYTVFEIKFQDDPPDWMTQLLSSGLLTEVPKFSKFLHGTALLFPLKVQNSLPNWFLQNHQGILESATLQQLQNPVNRNSLDFVFPGRQDSNSAILRTPGQMQVSTLCHVPENHTVLSEVVVLNSAIQNSSNSRRVVHHNTSVHGPPTPARTRWRGICPWRKPEEQDSLTQNPAEENRASALIRTRIEPKTFFANERTFLSWLTVAIMVMFLGLSLLDTSSTHSGLGLFSSRENNHCKDGEFRCNAGRISGALIAPLALVLMVYALVIYRKRSIQILRRETVRYDDPYGPIILTVLLVIVLFLAYILSVA